MHLVLIISLFAIYYFSGGSRSDTDKSMRRTQVILMGFCLFLFAALRSYSVGIDVEGYFDDYYKDATMSFSDLWDYRSGRDPFFHEFLLGLSYISDDAQFMLAVIGAIVAFGFSYFVFYQKGNVLLFFMIFIGFRMFSFTLSGLRQAIAMGLIYIAYTMLKRDKIRQFALLSLLAGLFHTSALVFLFAFFIMKIKRNAAFITSVVLVAVINAASGNAIASALAITTFEDRFAGYVAKSQTMVFEGTTTFYFYIIFFILALALYNQLKKSDEHFTENLRLLTVGVMFSFMGQSMSNVFRISYYYIFLCMPIFSQVITNLSDNKQTERTWMFVACVLLAAQYLILGTSAGTENYLFFWEQHYLGCM